MLKEYVFTLNSYKCNKNCPYCIAKMNKLNSNSFEKEINNLKNNIKKYKAKNIKFKYFILSGNGETSLYMKEELEIIKKIVESSNIFQNYRIQTSGNLFKEKSKLELFNNWYKEITVVSSNPQEDKEFYHYKAEYLNNKNFLNSNKIRVNIVLLKSNFKNLTKYIEDFSLIKNVETIALKILDKTDNNTKESNWVKENALEYKDINKITEKVSKNNKFINFEDNMFIYETKNGKILTINYNQKNNYDYISLQNKLRPKKLSEVLGQTHLIGKDKILTNLVKNKKRNVWRVFQNRRRSIRSQKCIKSTRSVNVFNRIIRYCRSNRRINK